MNLIFKYLLSVICFFNLLSIYPSIGLQDIKDLDIPSKKSFSANSQFVKPFKLKKITVAEYLTDPLILYTSLWGCFALTLPIWENDPAKTNWEDDAKRGIDKITLNKDVFGDRLKMEPFGTERIDPITKVWNGVTVFRNDIYIKNIIEPVFFVYITLYLRSKNYHPAIMITEVILLSVLYELSIRPFNQTASFEQLLKNPAVGLVIGILFDELSTFLLTTPFTGLHFLAYLLNPFNALPNSRIHPMLFFDPYRKSVNIEASLQF
jgi:hypothetical protein